MAFSKLLVANRGEIACRVLRSAQALGYRTVAVFSEADAAAPHVGLADEAICLGKAAASASYLDGARVLEAAKRSGADAIHPGYGFLAENADFAEACAAAGIVFVGPPVAAIRAMGDKAAAKAQMRTAGVPCVPGYESDAQDEASFRAAAESLGLPVLVKAAAGGGGRGMRRVDSLAALPAALSSARAEAKSAFGDGTLLLERVIEHARHIEVQVLGDSHGNIVHLGERDCSTQRRHQKVIEEAPSPAVDVELRERLGAAAVAAARAIGYVGAGTVEMLVETPNDAPASFYFLEMNTRLQVEHPVTELVTGLDLVALQLDVAAGARLPLGQDDVQLRGHAIEARLYAEDPAAGYLPQTGQLLAFEAPQGKGVRCDHGLRVGLEVSPHYDPLLAKVIAYGNDRQQARRRLSRALRETVLLGLRHNRTLLVELLDSPAFVAGDMTTDLLDGPVGASLQSRSPAPPPPREALLFAAALFARRQHRVGDDGFRLAHPGSQRLALVDEAGSTHLLRCEHGPGGRLAVVEADGQRALHLVADTGSRARVELDGHQRWGHYAWSKDGALHLELDGTTLLLREAEERGREQKVQGTGILRAPTSGRVIAVAVAVGDRVEAGQLALTLEAMKMETPVRCDVDGIVAELRVEAGVQVERASLLVRIEAEEA